MQPLALAGFVLMGAVLGASGGLFGIGGGLFAIPILGVAFGLDEQHAQGTALVMVVPNVAVGLYQYAKRAQMDARIGLALALAAFPLTFLGAAVATHLPSAPLRVAFALFMFTIALFLGYRSFSVAGASAGRRALPWPFATIVGAVGGVLSGLFGAGGAIFSIPLMSMFFGVSQATAQGFGLALVAPGTVAGIVTYALVGDVDWRIGAALAAGGIFTVPWGVALAHRLPERTLRLTFCGLLLASAAALVLKR